MANANLFQQYLQPVRSAADYSADMDKAEANQLSLVALRNKNALDSLTNQQAVAKQNALQKLMSDPGMTDPMAREKAMLSNPLLMQDGMAAQASRVDNENKQAQTRERSSVADKNAYQLQMEKANKTISDIASLSSPQDALAGIEARRKAGDLDEARYQSVVASLKPALQDPSQFGKWQRSMIMTIMDGKDRLSATAPKPTEVRLGNRVVMIDTNPDSPTYKQEVTSAQIGVSPDTLANNATSRANNAATIAAENERAKAGRQQAATADDQRVTYQQDANGNLVALPVKISGGAGSVSPVPVVAGGKPMQGKGSPQASFVKQYGIVKNAISDVKDLLPKSTHSGLGSAVDATANFFGQSTEGADAAAKLDTIGGWLTSTVPRFEGPQSDKDVAQYKMMAGNVANRNLPVSQRLQAVAALEKLMDGRANAYGIKTDAATPDNASRASDPIAAELARRGHK
jgi:hypothetical protein